MMTMLNPFYALAFILLKLIYFAFNLILCPVVTCFFDRNRSTIASLVMHSVLIGSFVYNIPDYLRFNVKHEAVDHALIIDLVDYGTISNVDLGMPPVDEKPSRITSFYSQYNDPDTASSRNEVSDHSKNDMEKPEIIEGDKIKEKEPQKSLNKRNAQKVDTNEVANDERLSNILKSIKRKGEKKNSVKSDESSGKIKGKGKIPFNKSKPVTIGAIDSIRSKFISCWKVPYGAKNAETIQVIVNVKLDINGKVVSTKIMDMNRYRADSFYRVMADSAVRAIIRCSPIDHLPKDRYQTWSEIELNFDPSGMFN